MALVLGRHPGLRGLLDQLLADLVDAGVERRTVPEPSGRVARLLVELGPELLERLHAAKRRGAGPRRARRAATEPSGPDRAGDLVERQHGGQRRRGGLVALVLALPGSPARSSACSSVSQVSSPKPTGDAGLERDPGQAVGGRAADVVEVRRAAADDDAERDDRVVALARPGLRRPRAARRSRARGRRPASSTWWPRSAAWRPATSPSITCSCQLRGDDRDPQLAGVQGSSVRLPGFTCRRSSPRLPSQSARARPSSWWPIRSRLVSR